MHYARFNLGVALLRSDRLADGARFLDAVGSINTADNELLALKDKANLALGFAYLQANAAGRGHALPGAGAPEWPAVHARPAGAGLGRGRRTASSRRRSRPGSNCATATCWMPPCRSPIWPCPMPSRKLGANGQAAEYYEQALKSFDTEQRRHR